MNEFENIGKGREFLYEVVVREHHLDMNGHMNNAAYAGLYEDARWEMIYTKGFGLERIQKEGVGTIVTALNIRFRKEVFYRENLTINCQSLGMKNAFVLEMKQRMLKEDGVLASDAAVEVAFFDLKKRKLLAPTKEWLEAVGYDF